MQLEAELGGETLASKALTTEQQKLQELEASFNRLEIERLFRSLKSEWIPSLVYTFLTEASRDISHYLMTYYNWERPHQHNDGVPPAKAEEKLNLLSGNS